MESDNDSNVGIVGQGDSVKRSYFSKGDTPGKPSRKNRKASSRLEKSSSRALFQTPVMSPKVSSSNKKNTIDFIIYICTNELICT